MAEPNEDKNKEENKEGPFKIMDGVIAELNRTKKMFIIMILTIMIIPPISFAVIFGFLEPPVTFGEQRPHERFPVGLHPGFISRIVPLIISAVWLGIGIRQWLILSAWTKKYERYKKLQDEIDRKLED